ncbi:MAG: sodium/glutamate symporter [Oscillospiraceae bacterium]|nr:sodium/glutamate symporter [Oscillospiraceae bacterium]
MQIDLGIYLTMALASAVFYFGVWLKKRVELLRKFCIPAPVAGGLLFALLAFILNITDAAYITLDTSLQSIFMTAFFTTVGFGADMKQIREGGFLVAKFVGIVTLLVLLQDVVGVLLSIPLGMHPAMGLCIGSIAMTGGHGNAASFGPMLEEMGVTGATVVSVSAATFGLVAGSVMGGPIARRLILKHKVTLPQTGAAASEQNVTETVPPLSAKKLTEAAAEIFTVMGIGSIIGEGISSLGITMPSFIGSLITAVIVRNVCDSFGIKLALHEIEAEGEACLNMFLSLALISLKLWELLDLALPMILILLAQALLMALYAYFVAYYTMGRDYTACCIAAGLCGFGMGATPNAMANMDAVTMRFGQCKTAYIVVAVVGGLFVNIANSIILTAFINVLI